jgi:hypothetical protein
MQRSTPGVVSCLLAAAATAVACTGYVGSDEASPSGGRAGDPGGTGAPRSPTQPRGGQGAGDVASATASPSGSPPSPSPSPSPSGDRPGPTATTTAAAACTPGVAPAAPPRVWLLTQRQYQRTVATLFAGRSPDRNAALAAPAGVVYPLGFVSESDRFTTRAASYILRDNELQDAWSAASAIAARLAEDPAAAACAGGGTAFDGCAEGVIKAKGELMFRRPLTAEEAKKYTALAASSAAIADKRVALATAFEAMLLAPQFLFRVEAGQPAPGAPGRRRLTPFEVAAALSYGFTDGPPDRPLWEAATSGKLADPAVVAEHVERLAGADLGAVAPAPRFVAELFRYGAATEVTKKEKTHNAAQLVKETDLMVRELLTSNGRRDLLGALLGSTVAFGSKTTAAAYGAPLATTAPARFTTTGGRVGILGQPSWLVAFSQNERNDPPKRGRFVMEELLCKPVPKAPIGVVAALSPDTKLTLREKLTLHRKDPTCAACHALMDPIGLGFEGFDHLGAPRTTEVGRPVDASGELRGSGDQDGPFVGLAALAGKLAASQRTAVCFAEHSLVYWFGRETVASDACAVAQAAASFQAAGGDYVALLKALFTSETFLFRSS